MNYRIAIIDDDPASHKALSALALKWSDSRGHTSGLAQFTSAESFLFAYDDEKSFDILLLDVEMDGMNGVELAKRLRAENKIIQIIFITAYSDYISEGYEVAALHYLLKPVDADKLFHTLDRAAERVVRDYRSLTVETAEGTILVPLYDIKYLEVIKNYVTVHAETDYIVRRPLGEFTDKLDKRFLRVGRSYIVNLIYIKRISKSEIELRSGETIPIPRGAYEAVNSAIIDMR